MPKSDSLNKSPDKQPPSNEESLTWNELTKNDESLTWDDLVKKYGQEIKQKLHDSPHTAPVDPLKSQELKDRETDRALKEQYAKWFIWILIGQLLVMNFIFFFTGLGYLNFSQWALNIYMSGTLAEVFGIVLVIAKHLFPTKK